MIFQVNYREFSTLDPVNIFENNDRNSRTMFENNFFPTQEPQKGYQYSYGDWVQYNKKVASRIFGGTLIIYGDVISVEDQI